MSKFNRAYKCTIDMGDGEAIIITPPLTINFSINRSTSSSSNNLELKIFNLAKKTRNRIYADRFTKNLYRRITLEIGYGDNLSTVFIGNIFTANSARQGSDIVTSITALDGGFDTYNTRTSKTYSSGITKKEVVEDLIKEFPNINQGKLGEIDGTFNRPVVVDGNTFGLIKKYTDNRVFIDLEQVNILSDDEVVAGYIPLINSASGLIGTPQRNDAFLTIQTMLEPSIIMGQIIAIESSVQPIFDGQYKVLGLTHSGTISESIGGTCRSTFNLLIGTQLFGEYKEV